MMSSHYKAHPVDWNTCSGICVVIVFSLKNIQTDVGSEFRAYIRLVIRKIGLSFEGEPVVVGDFIYSGIFIFVGG